MNAILQKVLDELNKETPRIDYLKGMLETAIEMSGEEKEPIPMKPSRPVPMPNLVLPRLDEGQLLDSMAASQVDKLRAEAERMNA